MNFFKNLSIKTKLVLISLIISLSTISLCASLFIFNDIKMLKERTIRNFTVLAETVGDNCIASLLFDDPDSAKKILSSLRKEYQIEFGVLYNVEGNIFAVYKKDNRSKIHPPSFKGEGYLFNPEEEHTGDLEIVSNIVFENETIGKVYLRAQMLELEAQKKKYALLTGLLLLITLLISTAIALKLQKIISKPILLLADKAKIISEEGKYDITVRYESRDEVGILYSSFNRMISKIKQREEDLVDIKDNLEKLVKERTKELNDAKSTAELATLTKSIFLAHMSHELRTPLNAIIGLSDLAIIAKTGKKRDEYMSLVSSSGRFLRDIVNNLIDLSKMESGKLDIEVIPLNLRDTVEEAVAPLVFLARQKRLSFNLSLDSALPRLVYGDPTRTRQIIMNLADNAIKFTKEGEVKIDVRLEEASEKSARVHFLIQDTGIGIPEDKIKNIFESFTQAEISTTREYGGSGLGTTISMQLVKLMNGSIWMESTPGEGTCAHVVIPFNICGKETDGQPFLSQLLHEETRLLERPLNILVVEDNPLNRRVAVDILKVLGHTVSSANNGKIALEMWKKENYDLILMDIMMPEMDVFETTRAIREIEKKTDKHTAIVALTADTSKEILEQCNSAGMMDDILFKPVDIDTLEKKIGWASLERAKEIRDDNPLAPFSKGELDKGVTPPHQPKGDVLFNLDHLRGKLGYDNKKIEDLLEWFKEDSEKLILSMEKALRENDFGTIVKSAHRLKGSALQIRAVELKKLAKEMEIIGKEGNPDKAAVKLADLKSCYNRLLKELEKR